MQINIFNTSGFGRMMMLAGILLMSMAFIILFEPKILVVILFILILSSGFGLFLFGRNIQRRDKDNRFTKVYIDGNEGLL